MKKRHVIFGVLFLIAASLELCVMFGLLNYKYQAIAIVLMLASLFIILDRK